MTARISTWFSNTRGENIICSFVIRCSIVGRCSPSFIAVATKSKKERNQQRAATPKFVRGREGGFEYQVTEVLIGVNVTELLIGV